MVRPLSHHRTSLLLVVVRRNKMLPCLFLRTALVLIYHHEFLCSHQRSVDTESAINGYTIREKALKSNTFQFRNHKPSELVTDCKRLWINGSPLDWGQDDSKSVLNSFYMPAWVTHSIWQAPAYRIWYMRRESFQLLIKRRAKWLTAELFWSSWQWGWRRRYPSETWYLWTKWLSRSICRHLSPSLSLLLSPQHLDTFGMEEGRQGLSHPTVPQGARVGLWSCISHDRDTSNPVRS